ncbi:hypothetical protein [Reichenbachiella ulvae]|uniref:pEK499-p136 HEPN domain-containing protein n=1 Tax=Reichenbachiella ulvae TaxID=2980104 RepID=A0ABT3CUQ0_9BACT|nr:hypothetical protein [Reichenbachiella ulvae]MCV9387322.1 hypothetical protein [Reichenbachiella ulvae]
MNNEVERDEILKNMADLCSKYRGIIIHETIFIETGIDLLISGYFTNNDKIRSEDLHILIAHKSSGISFSSKFQILSYLLNTHFIDFKKKHPKFLKSLDDLMNIRNKVAHRRMLVPEKIIDFDNDTIHLYWSSTKKGRFVMETEILNSKVISDFIDSKNKIYHQLNELIDLAENR